LLASVEPLLVLNVNVAVTSNKQKMMEKAFSVSMQMDHV